MTTGPFSVAGHCLVALCEFMQAPDSTIPLCLAHRIEFQASPEWLEWREHQGLGHAGLAAKALVKWLEREELGGH